MTTGAEENKWWANQVDELHHNGLKTIREVATKWQAALVAILATFATVAFVWGPEKLEKYPIGAGFWRSTNLVLLVLAGLLGIAAAFILALAAIGIPREFQQMTGRELESWTKARAKTARKELLWGMRLAGAAGILALIASLWLLAAAAIEAPAPATVSAVVVSDDGASCGVLERSSEGQLTVLIDGTSRSIDSGALVTVVSKCPEAKIDGEGGG